MYSPLKREENNLPNKCTNISVKHSYLFTPRYVIGFVVLQYIKKTHKAIDAILKVHAA